MTKSKNKIQKIRDYDWKKLFFELVVVFLGVKFIDDYFYQYFSDFVMPFVFSNFSVLKGILDNPAVIKKSKFANVIAGYYSMVQQRKSAYEGLLNKSYSFREELNKFNLKSD